MAAVNVPTNLKIKEKDVNQKLQLFGIYSAFANGKVPTNKQIDVAMNSFLASKALSKPSQKLSSEGKVLVGDVRDVVERAKHLLLTKNEGNLIQDFIYQCGGMTSGDASRPNAPVDKETAKQHGNEALEGFRTLGQLLISNGQFRKLLNDAVILLRDIAGDGAQNAAGRLNPSEDQLSQIDRAADDNTWHDTPDLSISNMKGQARSAYDKNRPFNKEGAKNALSDAQGAGQGHGTNTDAAMSGGATGAQNLRDQASANMPEETKQRAEDAKNRGRETMDKTKNYLSDKMPKERREQSIWRLKKMIVEVQGHQDYQRAIESLLRLAETYQGHAKDVGSQSAGSAKGAHTDAGLQSAEADLKVLIERFANSTSSEDLFDSINQLYRDADRDPELRNWFKQMDTYVRKCLKEQGFVMQDAANTEYNQLYDHGNFLLRERYRNHTDRVLDEVKFIADQFDQDPQNKAFAQSMNKLFLDLGNDENGKPTFKPHLLKDLSEIVIPGIFEHIRYVPIPRIEYTDPMVDLIVENLVIEGDNLAPNVFEFGSDNYFRWGRKQIASKNKNKVMMSVSGIQMDLRDVSYYVKKKQGFPSLTDKGVMDVILAGSGFSFKAAMETADSSDKNHFFKVNNVTVDIKNMQLKLKQSKYKLLFALVKPILLKVMKPALQKILQVQIKNQINNLDAKCYAVHQEAKRVEAEAKRNPEQAANIYQRYMNAAQKTFTSKKEAAQEKSADKQVNVAVTQHDSIFKNISLPGGISTKATEYKDLAMKGDKWESPVFGIGSASESTNIPRAGDVSRKPHNARQSVLREKGAEPAGMSSSGGNSSSGYGQSNGTASGFSGQVNSAFDGAQKPDLSLNNAGSGTTTDAGSTTLGSHNPVISGQV
ncbi:MAG: hypothetical protein M1828_006028 [Chrysothrix sp. TS-e1954]|nr:MAG: hypothetical protein M1828_006028 [Chrysothrix sp. TS-e1954]